MDFAFTENQRNIRDTILKHCAPYPDEYWLARDRQGAFLEDFYLFMADAGWLGFEACHTAMLSLDGMGYAPEYHVERYLRESLIPSTAPVSLHMILNFLAEKVLDLPKSY